MSQGYFKSVNIVMSVFITNGFQTVSLIKHKTFFILFQNLYFIYIMYIISCNILHKNINKLFCK